MRDRRRWAELSQPKQGMIVKPLLDIPKEKCHYRKWIRDTKGIAICPYQLACRSLFPHISKTGHSIPRLSLQKNRTELEKEDEGWTTDLGGSLNQQMSNFSLLMGTKKGSWFPIPREGETLIAPT